MATKFMEVEVAADDIARVAADDGAFFAAVVDEMVVEHGLTTVVEEELKKAGHETDEANWIEQFLSGIGVGGRAFVKILAVAIDQEAQ